jgi:hypothetical protein
MMVWLSIAAVAVVSFLSWNLYLRFGADRLTALSDKRRPLSRFVSRGEFIDGNRHMNVVLAVTRSTFFYENADMEASLELQFVDEIEYDTQLSTGTAPANGKVLRFRCHSQVFEFVVPNDAVAQWHTMLPPRRAYEPAVLIPVPVAAT